MNTNHEFPAHISDESRWKEGPELQIDLYRKLTNPADILWHIQKCGPHLINSYWRFWKANKHLGGFWFFTTIRDEYLHPCFHPGFNLDEGPGVSVSEFCHLLKGDYRMQTFPPEANLKMSFGKFKGKRLTELPTYYLHWLIKAKPHYRQFAEPIIWSRQKNKSKEE